MAESAAQYTEYDLAAAAASFGCNPWDVAGIFRSSGKATMSESEFRQALQTWRGGPTPAPSTRTAPTTGEVP